MENVDKYDNSLFGILQSEGKIFPFLETIFSFLYRRTDFFKVQHDKMEKIGFPKGQAEQIVKSVFLKFYRKALCDDEILQRRLMEATVSEEVPYTVEDNIKRPDGSHKLIAKRRLSAKTGKLDVQINENVEKNNFDSYNGAVRDNYSWSQTLQDVDVRVFVPTDVTSGKNVEVDLTTNSLCVRYFKSKDWHTVIHDKLTNTINTDQSMWTLVPGEHIHLNLEKSASSWWSALTVSEPSIDIKKIDASTPFEDLDEESQSKIREMVYNQEQKNQGKPTTEQMKLESILKEAWDKDGSIFKGQPFDPSLVEVVNSSDTVT